jgi:hypothetical protein
LHVSSPTVPKDPKASRVDSSVAHSRTTHNGGTPSAIAPNYDILKMLWDIFATCECTDQPLDVMDQRIQIVRRNQEIIHSQRDEPLEKFPDVPVFPPVPDPYDSLTLAELAAFDIGPAHISSDDDDDEETEDDKYLTSLLRFISLFPFWCLDDKGGEESYIY